MTKWKNNCIQDAFLRKFFVTHNGDYGGGGFGGYGDYGDYTVVTAIMEEEGATEMILLI